MKRVKRVLALLVAFALVLAMAVPAFAGEATYQLKVNASGENHTYKVYQIFTGEMSTNKAKEKVLSNIKWGKNGTGNTGDAVEQDTLTELESATGSDTRKLEVIKKFVKLDTDADAFATLNSANRYVANVPAGYYLVKDEDNTLNEKDEAYTTFLVNVVGENVELNPKSAKPSVDKFVQDEAADRDIDSHDSNGWGKTADHAINESFKFKLTATLTQDVDFGAYSTYKVKFTDTMSAGVTFESIDKVTVDGQQLTTGDYTCTANAGDAGKSWTLTINNIKSIPDVNLEDGAEIVVVYNAHLNENAYVNHKDGATTNENTVYLEYSNNPNASGELGKTPEENVWVFTYGVNNTKVTEVTGDSGDIEYKPLAGAGFRLYTDAECSHEVALIYDETLSAYRPTKDKKTGVEMKSADGTGIFNIVGLDAGVYHMRETTTPTGYNTCNDVPIVIDAKHQKTGTSNNVTFTEDSSLAYTIVNNAGTTLPSTGGMGTTVFYVVGGGLMAVAVVLLVTKKRMENKR